MKTPDANELLTVWEQGLSQPPVQRVLLLLAAAYPELTVNDILKWSIGQRDARLLELREYLFGPKLFNSAVCPNCQQRLEWENQVADFQAQDLENDCLEAPFNLEHDGYALEFRLPNSLDVMSIVDCENLAQVRSTLISRCIIKSEIAGKHCEAHDLSGNVITAFEKRLEQLDPQADINISLQCCECEHSWEVQFDIAAILWSELNDWAVKTLQTVYLLASHYGWSEQQILSLTPLRRRLYLRMLPI